VAVGEKNDAGEYKHHTMVIHPVAGIFPLGSSPAWIGSPTNSVQFAYGISFEPYVIFDD